MNKIKGYKAYNKGMKCQNFQFKENEIFEQNGDLKICQNGFHFCENPLDTLDYYSLCDSEFSEVEALGEIQKGANKSCTNKIKIGIKLDLSAFIKTSINFIWEKCNIENSNKNVSEEKNSQLAASGDSSKLAASGNFSKLAASGDSSQLAASGDSSKLAASGYSSKLAASGNFSQLAASGYFSKLAASGDSSKLAASGDSSKLAASGDSSKLAASGDSSQLAASGNFSQLAASGDSSQLEMTGSDSVGANIGINGIVKGRIGCWITLAEYKIDKNKYIPVCVKSAKIDGKKIKEDVFYKLENKKFIKVK
jgi:hypothetical protein